MKKVLVGMVCLSMLALIACKKDGVALIKVGLKDSPTKQKGTFRWVKTINRGQEVTIVDEKEKGGKWFKVQLADGETEGWVEQRYIFKGEKKIVEFGSKTKLFDMPDENSKVKTTVAPGTKGIVVKEKGDWRKVSITFQKSGWVKQSNLQAGSSVTDKARYEVYISGIGKCTLEASSVLTESSGFAYSPELLFDKKMSTSWQENKSGTGVGEWFEITFPETVSISAAIVNGFAFKDAKYAKYGEDGDLYLLNNRIQSLRVEAFSYDDSVVNKTISLEDNIRDFQDVGVYENIFKIRFIIDGVYKGKKWPDTSISEMKIEKL